MKYCPFVGEKGECCKRCLNIEREEAEKEGRTMGSFLPEEIDENEIHPYKCSYVKNMKEYEVNGEIRHKVFCEITQKWVEKWEYHWENRNKK